MKLKAQSRVWMALAALGGAFMAAQPVMAQSQLSNLFANASPSVRDRMFMRLDYIRVNVKTTSGDVQDVTGPVLPLDVARSVGLAKGRNSVEYTAYSTVNAAINGSVSSFATLYGDAQDPAYACESVGLGTPCGTRAKAQSMVSTPALSLGYYFDDDYKWAVEAFLLAKPLEVTIQGDGRNSLNGRDIIKLKMLPPTVTFSRYFGDKHDRIRPFVGVMGSYAIFYDVQATDFLNSYQGGGVGDTTVKVNNVLGWGGVAGLKAGIGDDWSLNLSVAKFRYKTDATITTKNTSIAYGATVLSDYGPNGAAAASTGLRESQFYTLMCSIAKARGTDPSCVNTAPANQGTFVRKASNVLDSTMFVLSLGRSF